MNKYFFSLLIACLTNVTVSDAQKFISFNKNMDIVYALEVVDSSEIIVMGKRTIRCWDLNAKKITGEYSSESDLTCMDVTPDGKRIAIGNKKGDIKIIKSCSNELVFHKEIPGQGAVTGISVNATGTKVAATFFSGQIGIFSPDAGSNSIFQGYKSAALCIAFSESGKYLATGGAEGYIKIWNVQTQSEITRIKVQKSLIRKLIWCDEDTKIISGGNGGNITILEINDFNTPPGQIKIKKIRGRGQITGIDYNEKTKSIIWCTLKGNIYIHFRLGRYKYHFPSAIFTISFVPVNSDFFEMAFGTNGRGVILVNSKGMSIDTD